MRFPVFVTSRAVACLRGGSFLGTFLVLSKRILCEWLPVIASPERFLLPSHASAVAFPSPLPLSLALSLSLSNLCHPFVLFSSLCYFLRLCILPKKWHQGLGVGGFFDLFIIFVCVCVFLRILKAIFDLKTNAVGLHSWPGCRFNFYAIQQNSPEVMLMMAGLQPASMGLLAAWEDDIFHQCFIFAAFASHDIQ